MCESSVNDGLAPKAINGVAMHKLVHLIYGVLKTGKPFDANWGKPVLPPLLLLPFLPEIPLWMLDGQDGI